MNKPLGSEAGPDTKWRVSPPQHRLTDSDNFVASDHCHHLPRTSQCPGVRRCHLCPMVLNQSSPHLKLPGVLITTHLTRRGPCSLFLGGFQSVIKKSCITKEMFFRIREGVFLLALCKTFPSKRRMIKNTLHPGPLKKQNLVMLAKKRL